MSSDSAAARKLNRFHTCPYNSRSPSSRWADAVTTVANGAINPQIGTHFAITRETRIATAGSCFAQNVARVLQASGFNYYCTESPPPWFTEAEAKLYNYGTFSARYGNIYTPKQLLQLFQRALGLFVPQEPAWAGPGGIFIDPFRPRIQPQGFSSLPELDADRTIHLRSVRTLMETLDVFIFTLGLTETWRSKSDGAVFPVAPGCGTGQFDDRRHEFYNLRVSEVVNDLSAALALLRSVNPAAKVILTVSPVPLVATMTDRHVLQATVYSKAVLRAAAEEIVLADPSVTYFAAYEIVTATLNGAEYFAADKRSVTDSAVDHVMRCFFDTFAFGQTPQPIAAARDAPIPALSADAASQKVYVICDEEAIMEALSRQSGSNAL